jgi:hypothetical protein
VSIWPITDSAANVALGQNLTVWLHNSANFSADTAPLMCDSMIRTATRFETYTQCMNVSTSYRYVTIQRYVSPAAALGLQEVRVYRSSECAEGPTLQRAVTWVHRKHHLTSLPVKAWRHLPVT